MQMLTTKRFMALAVIVMLIMSVFTFGVYAEDTDTAVIAETEAVTETLEATEEAAEDNGDRFYATFWALVPPVLAITLALITKEVYSSLFVGILAGGLLATNFSPLGTVDIIVEDGFISAVSGTAGIFIFLVLLGITVALINKTGAAAAFGKWAQTHIKSRVGAQLATFVLGVLIFIDDYFNCLTVGSVMLPVTDAHKVSRAKLAYIIDATAAPICMIAPISSWAAAVSMYIDPATTGYSGLELFVRAIPFNYYSLMSLLFVILVIVFKADFGPMAKHERNAIEKGDLFTTGVSDNKMKEELEVNEKGRVIDLIIPIIVLFAVCVFALVYIGHKLLVADGLTTADNFNFIEAFGYTSAGTSLAWGGLVALIVTVIYLICRRVVTFKEAMSCIPKGFIAMVPAITILTFATTLKNVCDNLGAAAYIENIMKGSAEALSLFLPAVVFLVACLLAFATGTSWGTFGILLPIVAAIFEPTSSLYFIGMSACLAGAVCGDHCSPISDTTIMSSAGAQCDHINHVSTQLPYAISVAACSFVAYIVGGLTQNGWIGLAVGAAATVGLVVVTKAMYKNRKA